MSIFLLATAALLPLNAWAQTGVTATANDSATPTSANTESTSTSPSSCTYSGSVTTYLSCEKARLSTTQLVAGGIGVTLGIVIIAFGCIWLANRSKNRSAVTGSAQGHGSAEEGRAGPGRNDKELEDRNARNDQPTQDYDYDDDLMSDDSDLTDDDNPPPPLKDEKMPPKTSRKTRQPMIEDVTDEEAPPKDEKAALRSASKRAEAQQEALHTGSPLPPSVRNLVPSNPSPNPRHLAHGSSRVSTATKNSPPSYPDEPLPPMPTVPSQTARSKHKNPAPEPTTRPIPGRRPSEGATAPLNIRKSTASSNSTIFPSYYGGSIPPRSSRFTARSDSDSEPVPPLPPYSLRSSPKTAERIAQVGLEGQGRSGRRPSHASGSESGGSRRGTLSERTPRRPSADKGGMI